MAIWFAVHISNTKEIFTHPPSMDPGIIIRFLEKKQNNHKLNQERSTERFKLLTVFLGRP